MARRPKVAGSPEFVIGRSLVRLLMPIRGRMTERIRAEGFTSSQYWVLQWVIAYAPTTPGRLARILNSSLPGITAALNRLEQRRFIRRSRGRKDRREVLVAPTAKGRRTSAILDAVLRSVAEEATRGLSKGERLEVAQVLSQLADRLDAAMTRPPLAEGD